MSHIISDELYNQLINSNTFEELQNSRDLIRNYKENTNDVYDANLFCIRSLSLNEYDKYIKNGTCNGAITQFNTNVWHFVYPTNFKKGLRLLNSAYRTWGINRTTGDTVSPKIGGGTYTVKYSRNDSYCFVKSTGDGAADGAYQDVNLYAYLDILCNNSNNTFKFSNLISDFYIECIGTLTYGGVFWYSTTLVSNSSINKNITNAKVSAQCQYKYDSSGTTPDNIQYYNFHRYMCFRPVFNYVDNNKSTNIYN